MAMRTGLEGKPWHIQLLTGLLIGGLLFGLGYWGLIRKQNEEIAGLEVRLADLERRIQEGERAARDLPRFREELAELDLRLERLLRILPARRNTPDLMRRIRDLAEQGRLELLLIRPGNYIDRDFYSEWPIAIQIDGTYHNLGYFFERVSRLPRIVNVDDMEISTARGQRGGSSHTIQATFTAKTFIYKEPEDVDAEGAVTGAAGGRP